MKIKLAVAAIVIVGGLASLAYAQRPSAICLMHGVSGSPTGAPINDKGQCEYSIPWMEAIQFIVFGRLATIKRVLLGENLQRAYSSCLTFSRHEKGERWYASPTRPAGWT